MKLIEKKDLVPIIHLDDVYIGQLIQSAGLTDQMKNSLSICTGFHALKDQEASGWTLDKNHNFGCILAGLVVLHKYVTAAELQTGYDDLTRISSPKIATTCKVFVDQLEEMWKLEEHQSIFIEWEKMFNKYQAVLTGRLIPGYHPTHSPPPEKHWGLLSWFG